MRNLDIRHYARTRDVPLWMIAKELNISESSMTRKLRTELSVSEKDRIKEIINRLNETIESNK